VKSSEQSFFFPGALGYTVAPWVGLGHASLLLFGDSVNPYALAASTVLTWPLVTLSHKRVHYEQTVMEQECVPGSRSPSKFSTRRTMWASPTSASQWYGHVILDIMAAFDLGICWGLFCMYDCLCACLGACVLLCLRDFVLTCFRVCLIVCFCRVHRYVIMPSVTKCGGARHS
jgi:hypothetical protein